VQSRDDYNKVICEHCNVEERAKIERIQAHLAKCMQFNTVAHTENTEMVNDVVDDDIDISQESSIGGSLVASASGFQSVSQPTKRTSSQLSMSGFTVKTSPCMKESLDLKIAKHFMQTILPLMLQTARNKLPRNGRGSSFRILKAIMRSDRWKPFESCGWKN
jgi:hypothetical protein